MTAARNAEQSPARPLNARDATTADLNGDGFLTLDEVLAMSRAGLSDQEIISRIRGTGFVLHMTPEQERYLTDRGVSGQVTAALR